MSVQYISAAGNPAAVERVSEYYDAGGDGSLPIPFGEASCLLIAREDGAPAEGMSREDGAPAGFMALVPLSDEEPCPEYACYPFVAPRFRRRGVFTRMLEELPGVPEDADLLFPVPAGGNTPEGCRGLAAALLAAGAEKLPDEYRMELCLPAETGGTGSISLSVTEEDGALSYLFFPASPGAAGKLSPGEPAARCFAAPEGDGACFYGFEVAPRLRGRGIGSEALRLTLDDLSGRGIRRVYLHVGEDNAAAVSLYRKTGFRVSETLSCYLY